MTLAVATPTPTYRVIGDNWAFRVQFTQMGGTALNLVGASVFADLYQAASAAPVLTLALGSGATYVNGNPVLGTVDFLVPAAATATFAGQDIDFAGPNYPNRLVPYVVDTAGSRITSQVIPIVPVDARSTRAIPPLELDPVTLTVGAQGPAGIIDPNTLAAAIAAVLTQRQSALNNTLTFAGVY